MILTGTTASADIFYHVNYSATTLPDENATRVTVALSLYSGTSMRATVDYRATVGTLSQSSAKEIMLSDTPAAFCTLPNLLIFHDEAGRPDAAVSVSATFGGKRVDFSCKLPLDSIDRASRFLAVPSAVAGQNYSCIWRLTSREFSHTLTFRVGNFEKTVKATPLDTTIDTSTLMELPLDKVASEITNGSSASATVTLTSMWGDVLVGTDTRSITVTVPANSETLPTITASVAPRAVAGFEGLYLQGKTPVIVSLAGEGKYGATIVSRQVFWGGKMLSNPSELEPPTSSGTVALVFRVTDSRGYTREEIRTITVLPYSAPRLLPVDGYGQVTAMRGEDGTALFVAVNPSIAPVSVSGVSQNGCSLQVRFRAMGDTAFGAWITLQKRAEVFCGNVQGVTLSRVQSYAVEVSCVDLVGERTSVTLYISTEEVSFHLRQGGMGAAFGKYAEEERVLEIAPDWTLRLHGNLDDSVTLTDTTAYARGADAPYCRVTLVGGKRVRVELSLPLEGSVPQTLAEDFLEERAKPPRTVFALCPCADGAIACVSLDESGTLTLLSLVGEGDTHTLHARLEYDAG